MQILPSPVASAAPCDSTSHIENPIRLREDLEERGYVFVRGLLPEALLREVRADIANVLARAGWLDPRFDPLEARANPGVGPFVESVSPEYAPVYDRILHLESFHSLPHHPRLVRLFRDLFDEEPLLHPRHIARIVFPNATEETTPPHQDYIHIRGSKNTLTAWFPLGDCPRDLGGLMALEGSHHLGLLPFVEARGAGNKGIVIKDFKGRWVGTDYRAGDVMVFNSLTVHSGSPNQTGNCLRLSMDVRATPLSEPVHPSSLLPHMQRVTWEQIYSGWKSASNQRYWEKLNLVLAEDERTAVKGY
ncbi:MAG: hypothetical protein GHCLOJNM_04313 [bacterium]|nr:hypothetical protein [bacterium]